MLSNPKRVYTLTDYTVEHKRDGWYFTRTSRYGEHDAAKGPYASISSLTLMIARELRREITKRDAPHAAET